MGGGGYYAMMDNVVARSYREISWKTPAREGPKDSVVKFTRHPTNKFGRPKNTTLYSRKYLIKFIIHYHKKVNSVVEQNRKRLSNVPIK